MRNPRLRICLTGISRDRPRSELGIGGVHTVELTLAFPDVSPAAIIGMPAVALDLIQETVPIVGPLPTE